MSDCENDRQSIIEKYGVDPDKIGIRPRGHCIVFEINEEEELGNAKIGYLCVYARDGGANALDMNALKIANCVGTAEDTGDCTYRNYYFSPLPPVSTMSEIDTSPSALRALADACWQYSSGNWAARAERMLQALAAEKEAAGRMPDLTVGPEPRPSAVAVNVEGIIRWLLDVSGASSPPFAKPAQIAELIDRQVKDLATVRARLLAAEEARDQAAAVAEADKAEIDAWRTRALRAEAALAARKPCDPADPCPVAQDIASENRTLDFLLAEAKERAKDAEARAERMRAALHQAAVWFQEYADSQRVKGDSMKAARNQDRADACCAAFAEQESSDA